MMHSAMNFGARCVGRIDRHGERRQPTDVGDVVEQEESLQKEQCVSPSGILAGMETEERGTMIFYESGNTTLSKATSL